MSFVVGLTGGAASGKTTVSQLFAKKGIHIIDADEISREVVSPGTPALGKIINHFGDNIADRSGQLDRRKLREIIFQYPKEKQWLEQLLHPLIRKTLKTRALADTGKYCIVAIPLLAETNHWDFLDRIVTVESPIETQIKRLIARDKISEALARSMLEQQASNAKRRAIAHDVIINDGQLQDLAQKIDQLHQQYLILANEKS